MQRLVLIVTGATWGLDVPVRSWVFLGSVLPYLQKVQKCKRQRKFLNGGSNSCNTC